jgi:hypothetical protein
MHQAPTNRMLRERKRYSQSITPAIENETSECKILDATTQLVIGSEATKQCARQSNALHHNDLKQAKQD